MKDPVTKYNSLVLPKVIQYEHAVDGKNRSQFLEKKKLKTILMVTKLRKINK